MSTVWQTIAQGLLALALLCVLNCCTYQKTYSRPKLQELPAPMEVKPETAAIVPETPSEIVPSPPTPKPRFYTHMVRWPGETLSIIAQWYTGSWKNWKALSKANPTLNPKRIVIGGNIFIPEDLMKSRKPMPLSFLPSSIRKKGVQSSPPKKPSIGLDAVELFGPIVNEQSSIESGVVELFGPIVNEQSSIESGVVELFGPIVNEQALIDSNAIELFKPTE